MNTMAPSGSFSSAVESEALLQAARHTLNIEAQAIGQIAGRLDEGFARAVQLILDHPGKVIVSGMGKSGLIAQKIASTLCSTGTPAVFLHPAEAIHGDIGVYSPGDPSILLSKSGSTAELLRLVPLLRQHNSPRIAILGNTASRLAEQSDVVLDASVEREADPLGLAPTSSAMTALAMGDALASALMQARRFTPEDFATRHPGGQLGRNLTLRVADVMHRGEAVAWAAPQDTMRQVLLRMTERPLGAACVIDEGHQLLGLITEGDLRRAMMQTGDVLSFSASEIMTKTPISVDSQRSLRDALKLMEDRPSQLSVLPVVEQERCLGLIRIHDIYQPTLV